MSFSHDVKKEMAQVECGDCCKVAESYGLLLFGRAFSPDDISILTENEVVARKYADAAALVLAKAPHIKVSRSRKYTISVDDEAQRRKILSYFGHDGRGVSLRINLANFSEDCCIAAFMRGAFFSCGTVTSPESEYHLDFSVPYRSLCRDFIKLFDEFEMLSPKSGTRNGTQIIYFKDSTMIEDALALMGAMNSSLELMNIKIYKDIRNNVNRKVNFESANIDRSVQAAGKHIEAIKIIEKTCGLNSLSEELRELALLRLENPEMSLNELAQSLNTPVSRSCVNHRLNKLIKISEKADCRVNG